MKNIRGLFCIIVVTSFLFSGCTPAPITTSKEVAEEVAEKMVFVKQKKTGLCFGIVSASNVNSNGGSVSISVTNVPCAPVASFLIEEATQR